jgi:ribosomal protein S6 kinase beta
MKGIIHADLKPENIFIKKQNDDIILKIGDFGINSIKKYEFFGSLMFVAPEIVDGKSHSKQSDIFSFGGIMLRMMNGRDQFLYLDCLENKIKVENEYSDSLVSLVKSLLELKPENRISLEKVTQKLKKLKF